MDRHFQRTGLLNWLALLGLGAGLLVVARMTDSATAEVSAALVLGGLLTALTAWFQMRLAASEEAERIEMEDLARSRGRAALFDSAAPETYPARRAREQFERWVVPAFTLLLFLVQAGATGWFFRSLRTRDAAQGGAETLGMAMFASMSLVAFLLGKYSTRLAQLEGTRLLRPGGSALMLGSLLAFLAAATEALQWLGFPRYDTHAAWVLVGIVGLVAAETLFALVFEAYRPRVAGREVRLIYESRLVGLLGQPAGLFATAAQALDYQFGFKVSDTWFYRFVEEKIGRFALAWIAILALSDCVLFIEPGELALRERFGRPVGEVIGPGPAFKFPVPVDRIRRFPAAEIQSFNVGFVPDAKLENERTLLWTRAHYKEEFNLLVASREQLAVTNAPDSEQTVPVNLLTVSIPVQFRISDVRAWAYNHADPKAFLERVANREAVRYMASVDIEKVMSDGRLEASQELRARIGSSAAALGLGVEIVFVGLQDIHPPIGSKELPVAAAYEKVIGAEQEKESKILEAEGYALETLPTAQAESARTLNEARGVAARKVGEAAGRAAQFGHQAAAHRAAPAVFVARNRMETFARAAAGSRKLVLMSTNTQDVVTLNLEDKIRTDILDVNLEPVKKDEPKK